MNMQQHQAVFLALETIKLPGEVRERGSMKERMREIIPKKKLKQ